MDTLVWCACTLPEPHNFPERRQVDAYSPPTGGTGYIDHKPPVFRPQLTLPRLLTLDTLYRTPDTTDRGFRRAPEPALRAVEEGPEGQMRGDQGLTTLLALAPVLPPSSWRPTSRVPLPAPPSSWLRAPASHPIHHRRHRVTYLLRTRSKVAQAPATFRLPPAAVQEEKGGQAETQPGGQSGQTLGPRRTLSVQLGALARPAAPTCRGDWLGAPSGPHPGAGDAPGPLG